MGWQYSAYLSASAHKPLLCSNPYPQKKKNQRKISSRPPGKLITHSFKNQISRLSVFHHSSSLPHLNRYQNNKLFHKSLRPHNVIRFCLELMHILIVGGYIPIMWYYFFLLLSTAPEIPAQTLLVVPFRCSIILFWSSIC